MPTNPEARAGIWPFSDGEVMQAGFDLSDELTRRGLTLRDFVTASRHMIEALRGIATERCNKRNCGTVCLCTPCHARRALEVYDPEWRP